MASSFSQIQGRGDAEHSLVAAETAVRHEKVGVRIVSQEIAEGLHGDYGAGDPGRDVDPRVRIAQRERICLERRREEVATEFVAIRIKIGERDGRPITACPGYEECKRSAAAQGDLLRQVYDSAAALYRTGRAYGICPIYSFPRRTALCTTGPPFPIRYPRTCRVPGRSSGAHRRPVS